MPSPEKQAAMEALCEAIALCVDGGRIPDQDIWVQRASRIMAGIIEREKQPECVCGLPGCPEHAKKPGPKRETAEGLLEDFLAKPITTSYVPLIRESVIREALALIRAREERMRGMEAELARLRRNVTSLEDQRDAERERVERCCESIRRGGYNGKKLLAILEGRSDA